MSGIMMALLGSGGALGPVVTRGSYSITISSITVYYYGYNGALAIPNAGFGSITNAAFNGATVKAILSISNSNDVGNAQTYQVVFDGNRSSGFFNTLTIGGTLVVGTLSAPSYNSGNNETVFQITLTTVAATLFGTTDGTVKQTILT